MGVELTKPGIDLGIITPQPAQMLTFYRDVLGFRQEPDTPFPGGGVMHRVWCGESLIKLVAPAKPPETRAASGGITGATGMRYFTISVSNLEALVSACRAAGSTVVVETREARPGIRIAIVTDPDGNLVEFLTRTA
ncbi:MAG: VOC family protein [Gammaproteobacteria bacterium]|nr:VOC family protein [Gammaproteobacteria bacterium]